MSELLKDIIAATVVSLIALAAGITILKSIENMETPQERIVIPELKAEVY